MKKNLKKTFLKISDISLCLRKKSKNESVIVISALHALFVVCNPPPPPVFFIFPVLCALQASSARMLFWSSLHSVLSLSTSVCLCENKCGSPVVHTCVLRFFSPFKAVVTILVSFFFFFFASLYLVLSSCQ